jgi:hypothetical protein
MTPAFAMVVVKVVTSLKTARFFTDSARKIDSAFLAAFLMPFFLMISITLFYVSSTMPQVGTTLSLPPTLSH